MFSPTQIFAVLRRQEPREVYECPECREKHSTENEAVECCPREAIRMRYECTAKGCGQTHSTKIKAQICCNVEFGEAPACPICGQTGKDADGLNLSNDWQIYSALTCCGWKTTPFADRDSAARAMYHKPHLAQNGFLNL